MSSAHDYEEAHRLYKTMETRDLLSFARALRQDAKMSMHFATTHFAIERLCLIVEVLVDRAESLSRKARRFELKTEKMEKPTVEIKLSKE